MPFHEQPPGFSSDSLRLLDVALTKAWLEHVAVGASLSRADTSVCAALKKQIECLDQIRIGRQPKRNQPERRMAAYQFKIGQRVLFHSPRTPSGPTIFTILRLMPAEGPDLTYRIKSSEGHVERIAKERELSIIHDEPANTVAFDFSAPAELFPAKGRGFRQKTVSYKRFSSAAAAIQYAIEELEPDKLVGAVLEVNEDRFDDAAIRNFYASPDYPFQRVNSNQQGTLV